MTNLIYAISASYVISRILTRETITEYIREVLLAHNLFMMHTLFSCFYCMSVWVSAFVSVYYNTDVFVVILGATIINVYLIRLEKAHENTDNSNRNGKE